MFSKPMTTFTPERIEQILEFAEGSNPSEAMSLRADEVAVLARIGKAVMSIAPVYQCEFCHHDATGQLQWHWEDVNKAFYDKYEIELSQFAILMQDLVPRISFGESTLTDKVYKGFLNNDKNLWLYKTEIK